MRLALPSKGELEEPTVAFLKACGLTVQRSSSRRYTAGLKSLPEVSVLFQRAADIPAKVEDGTADLGITGLDLVEEYKLDSASTMTIMDDLGYGHCDLVVAVPEAWIDVVDMVDLAELAQEMRERGRELRVATKYSHLTQRFLLEKGVSYFSLVGATGAMEVAPAVGFADIIADLTSSGETLRENGLRPLTDGAILKSQACLIGNRDRLAANPQWLEPCKKILEMMEARLRAGGYYSISANIRGSSPDAVARYIMDCPQVAGLEGPTVSKVYSRSLADDDWYAVTVVVRVEDLLKAVVHIRQMGGNGITVSSPNYVFNEESTAYARLVRALEVSAMRHGAPISKS
ncbi:MAG: phosphoribosyltransferase [Dehalococcoidia bacterium]|nr:phosphoribosyltransferase [Dehalococcoidia bacterium]